MIKNNVSECGKYVKLSLGNNPSQDHSFQQLVKTGDWFTAKVDEPQGFTLVGCTAALDFKFADFKLADQNELTALFPQHQLVIEKSIR